MAFGSRIPILAFVLAALPVLGCTSTSFAQDRIPTKSGDLEIQPIKHASFVLRWSGKTVFVDPAWDKSLYDGLPKPDLILFTDIHRDHFDVSIAQAVIGPETRIIAPAAVRDLLPPGLQERTTVLANGASSSALGVQIEAVPMYNISPDRLRFHSKGRGNGYVLDVGGRRIYIAGDTEDTAEMRALERIDVAFIPMNLPYTMTIEQAADAVKAFRPAVVIPYHYGQSDVRKFADLVKSVPGMQVWLRDWREEGAR